MLADVHDQAVRSAADASIAPAGWPTTDMPLAVESSMAKMYVCEMGLDIVLDLPEGDGRLWLRQGGFDMERHVRDIVC